MMMIEFCNKQKGLISVFLTLILIPTFIFGGVIVDGSRILGAKNIVSGAGDMAMNGALSNYYEELNKTYGLLAMADTAEEVQNILKTFFETSLNAAGVEKEDFNKALVYLELINDDFSVSNLIDSEIFQTEVIKQEMLEYMKYRAPVTILDRAIVDRLGDLQNMEKEKKAADGELKFESSLDDLQENFDEIKKRTDELKDIYKEIKDEKEFNQLLSETEENYGKISVLAVTKNRLDGCADIREGDAEGLMREMVDLVPNLGSMDSYTCSCLIKMQIISNSVKEPGEILDGLEEGTDEYTEKETLLNDYYSALENLEDGKDRIADELEERVNKTYEVMHNQRELAEKGKTDCEEIQEKTKELREKFKDLREKYNNWNDAVNNLPAGESKSAYEENLEEYRGFFDEAEGVLGGFEEKIENNLSFYTIVCEKLDGVVLGSERIDWDIKKVDDVLAFADGGAVVEVGEVEANARKFIDNYDSPMTMELSPIENIDISDDAFVKKLDEEYCNTEGKDEGKANEYADKWDKELSAKTSELNELLLCTDLPDLNIGAIAGGDLPSNWLHYTGGSADGDVTMEGGIKDKDSREKATNKGSENLNQDNAGLSLMSALPSMFGKGVEELIEPPILTEYVIGMFSHNTSNYDLEGNDISDPLSISNSSLKDNQLYRAEIEYILWGDYNIRNNVRATKAIIFAANFVFNLGFAFTNPTIRRDAIAVASVFPVGALGKTAIKCALQTVVATIETTKNMLDLMKGKRVPLIKAGSAWDTWIFAREGNGPDGKSGFTYEDYLWILVCVNMYTGNQAVLLARSADLMELNLTNGKTDSEKTLYDKYTMIEVDATVKIDTFFLNKLGGAGYNVQTNGEEGFTIPYCGVQGY